LAEAGQGAGVQPGDGPRRATQVVGDLLQLPPVVLLQHERLPLAVRQLRDPFQNAGRPFPLDHLLVGRRLAVRQVPLQAVGGGIQRPVEGLLAGHITALRPLGGHSLLQVVEEHAGQPPAADRLVELFDPTQVAVRLQEGVLDEIRQAEPGVQPRVDLDEGQSFQVPAIPRQDVIHALGYRHGRTRDLRLAVVVLSVRRYGTAWNDPVAQQIRCRRSSFGREGAARHPLSRGGPSGCAGGVGRPMRARRLLNRTTYTQ